MDFEQLYQQYSPQVYRVCMGYINDHEHARDLVQETFIAVWQNLKSFRKESAVSTWIFRIATNNCLRALERKKRTSSTALPFDLPATADEPIEDKLQFLYSCIADLQETDRILISLALEDLPQAEIAEIIGISHANVRVKLHRIKEHLTNKFKEHGQFR